MAIDTKQIVQRLYPAKQVRKRSRTPRLYLRRLVAWTRRHMWKLITIGVLLIAWITAHVYYYNKLIDLEYDSDAAWAQVEAEQQRRYHVQQDVIRMVVGYAKHERTLMTKLTELRTRRGASAQADKVEEAPAPASGEDQVCEAGDEPAEGDAPVAAVAEAEAQPKPPAKLELDHLSPRDLNQIFPEILLTAEQYPNLRLTENFQQFSKAIIDSETRITEHIQAYNECVNDYTTMLKQFPGNLFGRVWGFEKHEFYVPERDNLQFRPIEYAATLRGAEGG